MDSKEIIDLTDSPTSQTIFNPVQLHKSNIPLLPHILLDLPRRYRIDNIQPIAEGTFGAVYHLCRFKK